MAKNLHLEHPEDMVLTGNLEVLDWFYQSQSSISVKIDGAPAIVWGTNPKNGKFFVCTKAAFNKKKIRLCYNEDDIFEHFGHQPRVVQILIYCLYFLPKTEKVYQGDWIGFGSGSDTFTPNTITYTFSDPIRQDIVIAPHTVYDGADDILEMNASPLKTNLSSTEHCRFVQPTASICPHREDIEELCKFAKQMSTLCEFVSKNQSVELKKIINSYIREGKEVDEYEISQKCGYDANLIRFWRLVASIKLDLFFFVDVDDEITCKIDRKSSDHEGYVMTNKFGTYKIVDRMEFSRMNFILEKNW